MQKRVLRHFRRHGLLEADEAEDMLSWDHGGGFSLDASVRIEATDRAQEDNALAAQVSSLDVLPPAAPEVPSPQPERANRKAPDTTPEPITKILVHIGEPTSPPLLHPARGPPQTQLPMGPGGRQADEAAQDPPPGPAGGSRGNPENTSAVPKTPPHQTFLTPPVRPAQIPPGIPGRRRAL